MLATSIIALLSSVGIIISQIIFTAISSDSTVICVYIACSTAVIITTIISALSTMIKHKQIEELKKTEKNKNDNIKAIIEKSNFCQTTNNILSDIKNQLDKIDEKINNSKKEGDKQ